MTPWRTATAAWCTMLAGAALSCAEAPAPNEPAAPVVAVGSSSAAVATPASATPFPTAATDSDTAFTAVVRVDAQPSGKNFQGTWLEREDGSRWLISYRADPLWQGFVGQKVEVRGERYQPDPRAQAVDATHFRVTRMRVLESDNAEVDPIEVRAEQRLSGHFEKHTHPAGSKLAGTTFLQFHSDDGASYLLANRLDDLPIGQPVKLRAREVTPSPFAARLGGRYLWLVALE